MPNVLTAEALRKLKVPAKAFDASLADMMRVGVRRLGTLQRSDGGWGWFDNDRASPLMTAVAVHGLSECRRLGYPVDPVMLGRGRKRLGEMARIETDLNRLAHVAFVLGKPDARLGAATELTPYALALHTLTLNRAGEKAEARKASKALAALARDGHWVTTRWYNRWENVAVETTAYAIRALVATDPRSPLIKTAAAWLLAQRDGSRWRSTKDTAVAIAALLDVFDLETLSQTVGAARPPKVRRIHLSIDGRRVASDTFDLNNPLEARRQYHLGAQDPGNHTVAIEVEGRGAFRFEADLMFEVRVPDTAAGADSGLGISVAYDKPLDRLGLGDEVTATVKLTAGEDLDYVMAQIPIPAGCEVVQGSGTGAFSRFEARYAQAIFYVRRVGPKQPHELTFKLRAELAGRYSVLRPSACLMYDEARCCTGEGRKAVIGR